MYYYQGACPHCEEKKRRPVVTENVYLAFMDGANLKYVVVGLCPHCFQDSETKPLDMEKIRQVIMKSERNFKKDNELVTFLDGITFIGYIRYGSEKYDKMKAEVQKQINDLKKLAKTSPHKPSKPPKGEKKEASHGKQIHS